MSKYLSLLVRIYLESEQGPARVLVLDPGTGHSVSLDVTGLGRLISLALRMAPDARAEPDPPDPAPGNGGEPA